MNTRLLYSLLGAAVLLVVLIFFFLTPSSVEEGYAPGLGSFDPSLLEGETGDAEITDDFLPLLGKVNPLTRQPYTEGQVKRIVYLAKKFPHNDLVPRPLSQAEAEARAEKRAAMQDLAVMITGGEANDSQIRDYYAFKEKVVRDRLELIEFVLEERQWPEDVRARYTAMRDNSQKVLQSLNERRETSLAILAQREAGGFEPPEVEEAPDAPDTDPEDQPQGQPTGAAPATPAPAE